MGVQEVRWDTGGTLIPGVIIVSTEKEGKSSIPNRTFVPHRIISVSAVMKLQVP